MFLGLSFPLLNQALSVLFIRPCSCPTQECINFLLGTMRRIKHVHTSLQEEGIFSCELTLAICTAPRATGDQPQTAPLEIQLLLYIRCSKGCVLGQAERTISLLNLQFNREGSSLF